MQVCPTNNLLHKSDVFVTAGELTSSPQHQRLINAILEMSVGRLHIAVLIGAPGIRAFAFTAVMIQQSRIAIGENSAIRVISHRGAERIRAMPLRNTTEFPERFLNPVTERFKRLRKAQRDRFHVAVGQHAVKQNVLKPRSGDRHTEVIADGKVTRSQPSRMMNLPEVHHFVRSVETPPQSHSPLKRAPSGIRKLPGVCLLQPFEQCLRLQCRFAFELPPDISPDPGKRIDSRSVVSRPFPLRGNPPVVAVIPGRFLGHSRHPCRSRQ